MSMSENSNSSTSEPLTPADEEKRRASRKKLILIFALFFVPLLLATLWMQMVKMGGGQWGNTSNGELITPAFPLTEFAIETTTGQALTLDTVRGKWTILYLPEGECTELCQETLYEIRQARLALNHRMERVQRVAIIQNAESLSDELKAAQKGVIMVNANDAQSATLVEQISAAQENMQAKPGLVYLIDPFGNLMMRYTTDLLPKPLYKDLKHLLKVSRIG